MSQGLRNALPMLVLLAIGFAAPALASVALLFQSADYVAVMVLGLVGAVVLAQGSVLKALATITFGALLGLIGTDITSGEFRLTMGFNSIADGLGFAATLIPVCQKRSIRCCRDRRH